MDPNLEFGASSDCQRDGRSMSRRPPTIRAVCSSPLVPLSDRRCFFDTKDSSSQLEEKRNAFECQGQTVVFLTDESKVLGYFAMTDTVRETSRGAIVDLHGLGIRTVLLTGDNAFTASAIAQQVGIDEARGDLLPEDKLRVVEQLGSGNGKVGMVGDGINDAPALATADVGFAMGAETFDTVVSSLSTCTFPDPVAALKQMARVCRPEGKVLLLEHGRSDREWFGRFQDRHADQFAEPLGCHWNREPLELVRQTGLNVYQAKRNFFGIFQQIESLKMAPQPESGELS